MFNVYAQSARTGKLIARNAHAMHCAHVVRVRKRTRNYAYCSARVHIMAPWILVPNFTKFAKYDVLQIFLLYRSAPLSSTVLLQMFMMCTMGNVFY